MEPFRGRVCRIYSQTFKTQPGSASWTCQRWTFALSVDYLVLGFFYSGSIFLGDETIAKKIIFLASIILLGSFAFLIGIIKVWNRHVEELCLAKGFEYEVIANNLKKVDNIVQTSNGELFATLERSYPKGKLIHISNAGEITTILDQLDKPDGLRARGEKLFILEKGENGRLIEYNLRTFSHRTIVELGKLEGLFRPEGIATDNQGVIYIAETGSGTVLAYKNGALSPMITGLNEPDQLTVDKNGALD